MNGLCWLLMHHIASHAFLVQMDSNKEWRNTLCCSFENLSFFILGFLHGTYSISCQKSYVSILLLTAVAVVVAVDNVICICIPMAWHTLFCFGKVMPGGGSVRPIWNEWELLAFHDGVSPPHTPSHPSCLCLMCKSRKLRCSSFPFLFRSHWLIS